MESEVQYMRAGEITSILFVFPSIYEHNYFHDSSTDFTEGFYSTDVLFTVLPILSYIPCAKKDHYLETLNTNYYNDNFNFKRFLYSPIK